METAKKEQIHSDPNCDSGFISGDITDSGVIDCPTNNMQGNEHLEPTSHCQDSGILLSEGIECTDYKDTPAKDLKSRGLVHTKDHISANAPAKSELWKVYYEQDENGDTQLHFAIVCQFLEAIWALIKIAHHPKLLDTPNDYGQSPLHIAAESKQSRVVRWLIVAGAKPNVRNADGDTPLHIAAGSGDLSTCRAILDPVTPQELKEIDLMYSIQTNRPAYNLEQWNYFGQTCVHQAALFGHTNVMRYLVQRGADVNAQEGCEGNTALHFAVIRKDMELVYYLLKECPQIDLEQSNYGGRSCLELGLDISADLLAFLEEAGVPCDAFFSDSEPESMDGEDDYDNTW